MAWSADGSALAYEIEPDLDLSLELHGLPAGSSEPVVLATGLPSAWYATSLDAQHVVYAVPHGDDFARGLYSVPLVGGQPRLLHGPLGENGFVSGPKVAAGNRAVYAFAAEDAAKVELFSVPIEGGSPTRLGQEATGTWRLSCFRLTPDGQTVVYCRDRGQAQALELYSVPVGGGTHTLLISTSGTGSNIGDFRIAPDSSRVVYRRMISSTKGRLFSVPIDGSSAPVSVSATVDGTVGIDNDYWITGDSNTVVYILTYSGGGSLMQSMPITGGSATVLRDQATHPAFRRVQLATGTDRVLFVSQRNLHTMPATGGPVEQISTISAANGSVEGFGLDPTGTRVVYLADAEVEDRFALYSASTLGGPPVQIDDPSVGPDGLTLLTPHWLSSSYVFFLRDGRLFATPIEGGTERVLDSTPAPEAGGGLGFPSPNSETLAYISGHRSALATELFMVDGDGGPFERVSQDPRQEGGTAERFLLSADGRYAAFLSDREVALRYELFVTRLSDGAIARMSPPLDEGLDIAPDFAFSSGGSELLFRVEKAPGVFDLWAASIPEPSAQAADFSAPDDAATTFGEGVVRRQVDDVDASIDSFQVLSSGNQVRWLADGELRGQTLDGSASELLVNFDGMIRGFWIAPGEGHIAFAARPAGTSSTQVFAVPIDGGSESALGNVAATSNLPVLRFSPDGQWLYYYYPGWSSLFLASIDGQTTATPDGSTATAFFAPDSSAFYTLSNDNLVRYPVGSASGTEVFDLEALGARQIAEVVLAGNDRLAFALVVEGSYDRKLASVPLAGGTPKILTDPAQVVPYGLRASPSGNRLFFRDRPSLQSSWKLWTVDTGGGEAKPFQGGSRAELLALDAEERWVFYLGDGGDGGGPLVAEPADTGTANRLTPEHWAVQADLVYDEVPQALFFRAEIHSRRTGFYTIELDDFVVFADGFESGNIARWSNGG